MSWNVVAEWTGWTPRWPLVLRRTAERVYRKQDEKKSGQIRAAVQEERDRLIATYESKLAALSESAKTNAARLDEFVRQQCDSIRETQESQRGLHLKLDQLTIDVQRWRTYGATATGQEIALQQISAVNARLFERATARKAANKKRSRKR